MLAIAIVTSFLLLCTYYKKITSFSFDIGNDLFRQSPFFFGGDCTSSFEHRILLSPQVPQTHTDSNTRGLQSIESSNGKTYPYTIITALSSNHLCSLEVFLHSLQNATSQLPKSFRPRIVVYSLGILPKQIPVIMALHEAGYFDYFIDVNWSLFPSFWHVMQPVSGQYAWKLGIIDDAARRWGGMIVWLDAGNKLTPKAVTRFPQLINARKGFWSPKSSGDAATWTHPGMLDWFEEQAEDYVGFPNCNGAVMGYDFDNEAFFEDFWSPLMQCAIEKECIGPEGSNRTNHRHDQSAITIMARKNHLQCKMVPSRFGIVTHNDRHCWKDLQKLRTDGQLLTPSYLDLKFSRGEIDNRTN